MSEDMNLEGGTTARRLSMEVRDGTNLAIGNLQRGQPSRVESHRIREILKSCFNIVAKVLSPGERFGILMKFLSFFSVLILDPSFFYILLINADKMCIAFDKKLGIIGCIVLRSISDFFCLIFGAIQFWTFLPKLDNLRLIPYIKIVRKFFSLLCISCILPVQQVLLSLVFAQRITGSGIGGAMTIIGLHIGLRIMLMMCFTIGTLVSSSSGGSWTFIVLYFFSAHVSGAMWYFMAIVEELNCWQKACIQTGCKVTYCDGSLNSYMPNTTISCNFGIYDDVIKYKLGEETSFGRKLSFCFRWGIQSLSCFGQNLQPNGAVSQNVFAIMISIVAILLFTCYIVYMQRYMQSVQENNQKREQKIKQIENCMPFTKLSKNLQLQVRDGKRHSIWQEITDTKGIDVVNLLSNLSEDLTKEIKRELCLELLKNVKQSGRWSETLLKELCDCVKPVSYAEGTYIVRDKELIDEMLFLVQGKLRTYSFKSVNIGSISTACCRSITTILKEGEVCGEELVVWFQGNCFSCDLPLSTKNVQTLTKVDGFTLSADDLKIILIKHHEAAVFVQKYWRSKMMKKHQINKDQTSTNEQTLPIKSKLQLSLEISVQKP